MNSVSRALQKARGSIPAKEGEKPLSRPTPDPEPNHLQDTSSERDREGSSARRVRPSPEPFGVRQIHLRDYLYLLRKRKWLVFGMSLLVPVVTADYTVRQAPEYWATATLQVSQERVRLVEDLTVGGQGGAEFYGTQLQLLQSTPLSKRVVARLKLWEQPPFEGFVHSTDGPTEEQLLSMANVLRTQVVAEHVEGTQLIRVSCTSPDAELSASVANALLQEYIAFQNESESGVAQNAVLFIQEQIQRLERQVEAGETALSEETTPQSKNLLASHRLESLSLQLADAEALRSAAQSRWESMQNQLPETQSGSVQDASVTSARQQYETMLQQQNDLSSRFGPDWPELQRVKSSVEEAKKRLDAAIREVAGSALEAARLEYESALRHETRLREQVEQQRRQVDALADAQSARDAAKMEVDAQKEVLEQLLRRQSEAGITAELGESTGINARIVDAATPPSAPYKPNLRKNLMIATVAGLCLALGLALFMEYWEGTVDTPEYLRRHFSVSYLGMVPRYAGFRAKLSSSTREMYVAIPRGSRKRRQKTQSRIAERFRLIRTVLLSGDVQARTILVTSPDAKSGRSFVACNLAISLAKLGRCVLLVDADLRIPKLHEIFRLQNHSGLADALTRGRVDSSAFRRTEVESLYLLTAGLNVGSPAEELSSQTLGWLVAKLAASFDHVVFDSAPILPVPDPVSLAKECDEVILVVRSRFTTEHALGAALDLLDRSNAHATGIVLNGVYA